MVWLVRVDGKGEDFVAGFTKEPAEPVDCVLHKGPF